MTISIYDVEEYLEKKVEEKAKEAQLVMKNYMTAKGHVFTGALVGSIVCEREGRFSYFVGSYHEHARRIYYGRKAVRPVRKKALSFTTKFGHHVVTKYSSPVPPDDFVSATIARMS